MCARAEAGRPLILNVAALEVLRGRHAVLSEEVRRYTPGGVRRLLAGAGFEIDRLTFANASLFPIMLPVRVLQRMSRAERPARAGRVRDHGAAGAGQRGAVGPCRARGRSRCASSTCRSAARCCVWHANRVVGSLARGTTRGAALAARLGPPILAAAAGASAWMSLGALAVVDASTRARIGALPPFWTLAVLVGLAAAAAWAARLSLARAWPLALTLLIWLPWLPGRLPAAFLIWHGPVVWLIWIAAGLGLCFGGERSPQWPRALTHPARAPWIAALIAAAGAAIGAAALDERIPTGDEPHYLIITQSLLGDGDLRIENNHRRGDYFAYFPTPLRRTSSSAAPTARSIRSTRRACRRCCCRRSPSADTAARSSR